MGFPTKNDHFGVFWGYHHLRKHPQGFIHPKGGSSVFGISEPSTVSSRCLAPKSCSIDSWKCLEGFRKKTDGNIGQVGTFKQFFPAEILTD